MKKEQLYQLVKSHWPQDLNISDSKPLGDEVFVCPSLDREYDRIAAEVGTDDAWIDIGCWAFSQALWERARENFDKEKWHVKASEVTLDQFDKYLRMNLEDESWAAEREEYFSSNPR